MLIKRAAQRFVAWLTMVESDEENVPRACLAGPAGFVTLTKRL